MFVIGRPAIRRGCDVGREQRRFIRRNLPGPRASGSDPRSARRGWHTGGLDDNYKDSQEAEIEATGLAPTDDLEAAIVTTLLPGNYTAILRGKANGVGQIEVYDLETTSATRLVNISTRAFVGPDDNKALIGGFIIDGQVSQQLLIRAIGPSLSSAGVSGALADPTIDFYRGSELILSNDNWKTEDQTNIENTGIPPTNDKESAILVTLDPGSYTAVIRGKNNITGVALVEVYQIQ